MWYLDLLSLLLGLLSLLGGLGSISSGITGSLADSRGLLTLGNDLLPAGTNDGTLELGGLAGALLGDLLLGTLLVETTVEDSPVELTRVLLGQEVGLALAVQKTERLISKFRNAVQRAYNRFVPCCHHEQRSCRDRDRSWHQKSCTARSYAKRY